VQVVYRFCAGAFGQPVGRSFRQKESDDRHGLLRALFVPVFILAIVLRNSACLFVGAFLLGLSGVMFNPAAQACLMFANPGIAPTGVIIESVSLLCGMYWLAGLRPNVANRNGVFM